MKRSNIVLRTLRMILIILSVSACCGGLTILIIKTTINDVPLTSDAWLGFWGSIIGSVVTILGIALTLSYENKQNNTIRRLEAQPIITMKPLTLDAERTDNEGAYDLDLFVYEEEVNGTALQLDFPDIEIHNIGLNFATKVNLHFEFKREKEWELSYGARDLSILDTKETKHITVSLEISKEYLYRLFNQTYIHGQNDLPHAVYMRTLAYLARSNRKESQERIEKVSYVKGSMTTTFDDIYGNTYEQKRSITLHYVELQGEEAFVYMSFPEFVEAKLIR